MPPRWLTSTSLATLFAFLVATLLPHHALAQQPDPNGPPPPDQQQMPPPQDDVLSTAKQHFEAGRDAYQRQDFAGAVREFKAAQALRPSPVLDYNIGLAYEGLNKPKAAVKYYRRYLQGKPDAPNRPEVEQKIATLDAQAGQQPAVPTEPGQPPSTGDEIGQAPPPVAPPQTYSGYDPYGGQYQYSQQPYQAPPKKKRSYWWIVFPIVGGVLLLALLIWLYVDATTTTYSTVGLGTAPPNGGRPNEPGVLFRF